MKFYKTLINALIITSIYSYEIPKNEYITDYVHMSSSIENYGDIYKLETTAKIIHNDFWIHNNIEIEYRVYKNNIELFPYDEKTIISNECNYINGGMDNWYDIEIIEDKKSPGWIIYSKGICAANHSKYNAEIIFPDQYGTNYFNLNMLTSEKVNIVKDGNLVNIYYDMQKWNAAGTSCSIYVPRKKAYDLNTKKFIKKPMSVSDIERNEYGFKSLFFAGLIDLNPILMQYALDELYDSNDNCMDSFFGRGWEEDIKYGNYGYLFLANTSIDRFQKVIDDLWNINTIMDTFNKH